MSRPPLEVRQLGVVSYAAALDLQRELVTARQAGRVSDVLLLLEHPHVITLGVSARRNRANVLASPAMLDERGVELCEAPRGGDVTYHGPGRLVGYPVLDLKPDRCDVHRYVRDLEEVLIGVAAEFGVHATRVTGLTGVWVGNDKVAAIGVRLTRWVTSHGFAFNVNTDLDYFKLIRPCGIEDRGTTSLSRLTGRKLSLEAVGNVAAASLAEVFGRELAPTRVPVPDRPGRDTSSPSLLRE